MPTFAQRNCILNSINWIDQISTDDNGSRDYQFKHRCLCWKSVEIDDSFPSFLQPMQIEAYETHLAIPSYENWCHSVKGLTLWFMEISTTWCSKNLMCLQVVAGDDCGAAGSRSLELKYLNFTTTCFGSVSSEFGLFFWVDLKCPALIIKLLPSLKKEKNAKPKILHI